MKKLIAATVLSVCNISSACDVDISQLSWLAFKGNQFNFHTIANDKVYTSSSNILNKSGSKIGSIANGKVYDCSGAVGATITNATIYDKVGRVKFKFSNNTVYDGSGIMVYKFSGTAVYSKTGTIVGYFH